MGLGKMHLREPVSRIIYDDCSSTFEELLEKDGAVSIHVRNIRRVAIEMYKVFNGIAPEVISELFRIVEEIMLGRQFVRKRDKTVYYGQMSFSSFGPIVWSDMLPESIKK